MVDLDFTTSTKLQLMTYKIEATTLLEHVFRYNSARYVPGRSSCYSDDLHRWKAQGFSAD